MNIRFKNYYLLNNKPSKCLLPFAHFLFVSIDHKNHLTEQSKSTLWNGKKGTQAMSLGTSIWKGDE